MDPIANMLTTILNASRVKKTAVLPVSNLKLKILEILKQEGMVKDFSLSKENSSLVNVKPEEGIEKIVRVSKPGRRLYIKAREIRTKPGVLQIISTPAGVLTASSARKKHIGGEILFEVRS